MVPLNPVPQRIDRLPACGAADAPALVDRAGALTYAELETMVATMAGGLRAMGVAAGDRVATWLPKTRTACLMPLAAARIGAVHVPVNPALKRAQVAHILSDSGAAALVTQASRVEALAEGDVPPGCRVVVDTPDGDPVRARDYDSNALAAILYTSGSTGRPKG